jgi:HAD superfamily hydrolase (TIGR01450 family)
MCRDTIGRVPTATAPLAGAAVPLARGHDVALLDLDGVVYVGADPVPGAADALAQARAAGMRLAFVTNNAARTPDAVAGHLHELGIAAEPGEVVTSAQAAARYLAARFPAGAAVLVVGTTGLVDALREAGLTPVHSADDEPVAVVQGYSPTLSWAQLAEGAVAIGRGALWVACNTDRTIPSARGPLPGNGAFVAALTHATGRAPIVTGKPDPTMHRESVLRSHARDPIVVGDRLDTDIEGANRVGCPSLLVLSGVTTPSQLLAAPAILRPSYLAEDLTGLLRTHPEVTLDADGAARSGRFHAARQGDAIELSALGAAAERLDALRALCRCAWTGPQAADRLTVHAADPTAAAALDRLGIEH